jgi:alkylhydroperoxidase/carboxymuconolactone decarboxylase family protein
MSLKKETPYYIAEDLKNFSKVSESKPELNDKFFDWYGDVFKEGSLTANTKAIIALAVAEAVQCPYCIDAYTRDCIKRGISEEEMVEATHVAAAIKGGAALVHGVQMKKLIDKLVMK